MITEGPGECNIMCNQISYISILGLPNPIYSVNSTSKTLSKIPDIYLWMQNNCQMQDAMELDIDYEERLKCVAKKIRVIEILRGPRNQPTKLFYSPLSGLLFDPLRYRWPSGTPLLKFSAKDARQWMRDVDTR